MKLCGLYHQNLPLIISRQIIQLGSFNTDGNREWRTTWLIKGYQPSHKNHFFFWVSGKYTTKAPLRSLMAELSTIILLLHKLGTLFILRTSCKSENKQQKNPNKAKPTPQKYMENNTILTITSTICCLTTYSYLGAVEMAQWERSLALQAWWGPDFG